MDKPYRRQFLLSTSVAASGILAGCSSNEVNNGSGDSTSISSTETTGSGSTNAELRERVSELEQRVEELKATRDTKEETITSLEQELSSLRSKVDNKDADIEQLEEEVEQKEQRIEELESQNDQNSEFSDETLARAGELGRTVQQSVVKLTNGSSGGTGWVIEDGYIITNSHVTRNFETMDIETFDGRSGTATRVGYHENMIPDIALMKTNMETPSSLPMKSNTGVSRGDPVLTAGHPGRVGDWVISLGRYYDTDFNWELSDIPTSQGNSGSPIVTLDGVVFGCLSGTTTGSGSSSVDRPEKVYTEFPEQESLATAVPSKTIEKWVQEWK